MPHKTLTEKQCRGKLSIL